MSQKFIKYKNNNLRSNAFGKFFARAVYDKKPVSTQEIANFIQTQATVKKSDCIAVLDELGAALKHYLEMGQKVKIDGIGTFKVGFSSIGSAQAKDVTANSIYGRRVIFTPETVRVEGQPEVRVGRNGAAVIVKPFTVEKVMVKDIVFEETHENAVVAETENKTEEGGEG